MDICLQCINTVASALPTTHLLHNEVSQLLNFQNYELEVNMAEVVVKNTRECHDANALKRLTYRSLIEYIVKGGEVDNSSNSACEEGNDNTLPKKEEDGLCQENSVIPPPEEGMAFSVQVADEKQGPQKKEKDAETDEECDQDRKKKKAKKEEDKEKEEELRLKDINSLKKLRQLMRLEERKLTHVKGVAFPFNRLEEFEDALNFIKNKGLSFEDASQCSCFCSNSPFKVPRFLDMKGAIRDFSEEDRERRSVVTDEYCLGVCVHSEFCPLFTFNMNTFATALSVDEKKKTVTFAENDSTLIFFRDSTVSRKFIPGHPVSPSRYSKRKVQTEVAYSQIWASTILVPEAFPSITGGIVYSTSAVLPCNVKKVSSVRLPPIIAAPYPFGSFHNPIAVLYNIYLDLKCSNNLVMFCRQSEAHHYDAEHFPLNSAGCILGRPASYRLNWANEMKIRYDQNALDLITPVQQLMDFYRLRLAELPSLALSVQFCRQLVLENSINTLKEIVNLLGIQGISLSLVKSKCECETANWFSQTLNLIINEPNIREMFQGRK